MGYVVRGMCFDSLGHTERSEVSVQCPQHLKEVSPAGWNDKRGYVVCRVFRADSTPSLFASYSLLLTYVFYDIKNCSESPICALETPQL